MVRVRAPRSLSRVFDGLGADLGDTINRREESLRVPMKGAALLASMLSTGCSPAPPFEQQFIISVSQGGAPVPSMPVRLTTAAEESGCAAPAAEGLTDSTGRAVLRNVYHPGVVERYVVVVHPYGVCIMRRNAWVRVWHLATGPAPARVTLGCQLAAEPLCQGTVG